jgi:hypothetical protein
MGEGGRFDVQPGRAGGRLRAEERRAVVERFDAVSPQSRARITGVVYLAFFLSAVASEVFFQQAGVSGLQVGTSSGSAADTVNTMLAHQALFQVGFALGLISIVWYVAVTALFYLMFKPVSRGLSLIAALLGLMGQAVGAIGSLFLLAPFVVMSGDSYLSVFDVKQLQALAVMFLNLGGQLAYIDLVFDGSFLVLIGYLIFRSTFMPRVLGVIVAMAGLAWLTFLSPPLANYLTTVIEVLGIAAEGGLMLWLLVMGVNSRRWNDLAGREPAPAGTGSA